MLLHVRTAVIKDAAATPVSSTATPPAALCARRAVRLPSGKVTTATCPAEGNQGPPHRPAPAWRSRALKQHRGKPGVTFSSVQPQSLTVCCADSWRWIGDNLSFPPCTQTSPLLQSTMPRGQAQGRLTTAHPQRHSPAPRDTLCFTLRAGDPVCKPWRAPCTGLHSARLREHDLHLHKVIALMGGKV